MSIEQTTAFTVDTVPATNRDFVRRLDELVDVHLRAMDYPSSTRAQRASLWLHNSSYPDFTCAMAMLHSTAAPPDPSDSRQRCVGIAFTFRGTPETWWYRQVARGLAETGMTQLEISHTLTDYAELSEIHVQPNMQGQGIGRALFESLLPRIPQSTVMLSTPEVPGESNAAWRLYRRLGFTDVLRNFQFPADPRPFGILSRPVR
ncbi:GNAT family N-acetyltransferase [Corynebacterium falsenii]|uniref:GNAT family N-acetyltransferase n=1 Tax=Corynebacterium falsenii TaxID=108486 RepID=A0A418Q7K6_9CORY|nr:GNAT family N-acetyltransferase [Corynebacterium falsenii]MDC7103686.1 GNAT family N-acetyltransferase [Corynebacterium falsenii]RIX35258.1 GNAT family N-acetyltransferase [Corynebacterium falsenii]